MLIPFGLLVACSGLRLSFRLCTAVGEAKMNNQIADEHVLVLIV